MDHTRSNLGRYHRNGNRSRTSLRRKTSTRAGPRSAVRPITAIKNHINVDQEHKLIRDHTHTDASVHDSRVMEDIVDLEAVDRPVYADSAYRSEAREEMLRKIGVESRIHERAYAGTALTEAQKASNTEKSRVRARVEHTFGFMTTNMNGATFIRCIGSLRAQAIMILSNLTYNMSRFLQITKAPG